MEHPGGVVVGRDGMIGLVRLDRPDKLNALSNRLLLGIVQALEEFDRDAEVRVSVLHGSEKVFAAGADIGEMAEADAVRMYLEDRLATWERLRRVKKPIIAAVSGWALGGGCELAMACDMIVASETARFGQPESRIGVMPGAGGTQRMTRALGKALAMEVILAGRLLTAEEAVGYGLANRVAPVEVYLEEAKRLARQVVAQGPVAVRMAKEAVLRAFDTTLEVGLELERRSFYLLFASQDQKEGMAAFLEKRPARWQGR